MNLNRTMTTEDNSTEVRTGLVSADPEGEGMVKVDESETSIYLNRGSWMASLGKGESEEVTMTASSDGYSRQVTLFLAANGCFCDEDSPGTSHVSANLNPQAALRLVEQILTAVNKTLNEESWSPEHDTVEYEYNLNVLEDSAVEDVDS